MHLAFNSPPIITKYDLFCTNFALINKHGQSTKIIHKKNNSICSQIEYSVLIFSYVYYDSFLQHGYCKHKKLVMKKSTKTIMNWYFKKSFLTTHYMMLLLFKYSKIGLWIPFQNAHFCMHKRGKLVMFGIF